MKKILGYARDTLADISKAKKLLDGHQKLIKE